MNKDKRKKDLLYKFYTGLFDSAKYI